MIHSGSSLALRCQFSIYEPCRPVPVSCFSFSLHYPHPFRITTTRPGPIGMSDLDHWIFLPWNTYKYILSVLLLLLLLPLLPLHC